MEKPFVFEIVNKNLRITLGRTVYRIYYVVCGEEREFAEINIERERF